jgi:hypothetical protein
MQLGQRLLRWSPALPTSCCWYSGLFAPWRWCPARTRVQCSRIYCLWRAPLAALGTARIMPLNPWARWCPNHVGHKFLMVRIAGPGPPMSTGIAGTIAALCNSFSRDAAPSKTAAAARARSIQHEAEDEGAPLTSETRAALAPTCAPLHHGRQSGTSTLHERARWYPHDTVVLLDPSCAPRRAVKAATPALTPIGRAGRLSGRGRDCVSHRYSQTRNMSFRCSRDPDPRSRQRACTALPRRERATTPDGEAEAGGMICWTSTVRLQWAV